jgi:hypothetical protein
MMLTGQKLSCVRIVIVLCLIGLAVAPLSINVLGQTNQCTSTANRPSFRLAAEAWPQNAFVRQAKSASLN